MKLFVTGGCGFIGSHFIRFWLESHTRDTIVNLDLLTYSGNQRNLDDVVQHFPDRYQFVRGSVTNAQLVARLFGEHKPDIVVHFAAESHNSRAALCSGVFFRTNVLGTQVLLESARKRGIGRFQHISTCEVYGDLPLESADLFSEDSPLLPRTPYSASKAGADLAVRAYFETYRLPVVISRSVNNLGSFQHPEKMIPLFVTNALDGHALPIYRQSRNRREWVHVLDHCSAIESMIFLAEPGEIYNVGTGFERPVEQIADFILDSLGLSHSLKVFVPDRPGHDRRYTLNSAKLCEKLVWSPRCSFDVSLLETIKWYEKNRLWWEPLKLRNRLRENRWPKKQG